MIGGKEITRDLYDGCTVRESNCVQGSEGRVESDLGLTNGDKKWVMNDMEKGYSGLVNM